MVVDCRLGWVSCRFEGHLAYNPWKGLFGVVLVVVFVVGMTFLVGVVEG